MAAVKQFFPDHAEPGDRFYMRILGDAFTNVVKIDFGPDVDVRSFRIIDDGNIDVRIEVHADAKQGQPDVTFTSPGFSNTVSGKFAII